MSTVDDIHTLREERERWLRSRRERFEDRCHELWHGLASDDMVGFRLAAKRSPGLTVEEYADSGVRAYRAAYARAAAGEPGVENRAGRWVRQGRRRMANRFESMAMEG